MRRARPVQVLAAAAVIGLLASGAYAIAASRSSKVLACAKRHGGALRLAKHCRHKEKRVTWNRRGRTGPRGATGPAGAPGHDGAAGPAGTPGSARAYAWVHAAGTGTPSFDAARTSGFTGVSSPNAGDYCLTLPAAIDAAKVAPQASIVRASAFAGVPEYAYVDDPAADCSGNAVEVSTLSGASPPSGTPNLDFTVLVP